MTITVHELLIEAKQQLEGDTAALDAELLLAHVMQINRSQLYANSQQTVASEIERKFKQLIQRRGSGEPIAYIIGYKEFWSLPIKVTRDTLIPRPETEYLVEGVLERLSAEAICKIADLGTGSGAIALAIGKERPHWQITATDKMPAALAIAQQNAEQLAIHNIQFQLGNWCETLGKSQFDAIVSNPPYINKEDSHWQEANNMFEPITALLAPEQGLQDLRIIIEQAQNYLKPNGWLLLEHGYDQADKVKQLLMQYGYGNVQNIRDLANIIRVTVAQIS